MTDLKRLQRDADMLRAIVARLEAKEEGVLLDTEMTLDAILSLAKKEEKQV